MQQSEQKLEWFEGKDDKGASYVWAGLPDGLPGTVRIYALGNYPNAGFRAYWSESGEDVSEWKDLFLGEVFKSIDEAKAKCEANIEDIPQFETDYASDAVCPYCGYTHYPSYEIDFPEDGDSKTTNDCPKCEKTYEVYREVLITYSTIKIKKV